MSAPPPSDPYLPPPTPTDNPPPTPKQSAPKKTLLLWLVLIVMFVAVYQLFARHPPEPGAAPPSPPSESGPWSFAAGLLPGLLIAGLVIGWLWWQLRGGTGLNAALEPAHLAFADGDFARAVELYRVVEARYRKQSGYAGVVRLSLAPALVATGDHDGALAALVAVERQVGVPWGADARRSACIQLARTYALMGDLPVAERWLADARARLARAAGHNRLHSAAQLRLTEALVKARSGALDEAARLLENDLPRLEQALTGQALRDAWLLLAFAASQHPRASGGAWLALARTARPGHYDPLARRWPELRTFLAAHDLAARAPAA